MKISKTIRDLTSFNQICLQSWKLSQILMVITIMLEKALCVRYYIKLKATQFQIVERKKVITFIHYNKNISYVLFVSFIIFYTFRLDVSFVVCTNEQIENWHVKLVLGFIAVGIDLAQVLISIACETKLTKLFSDEQSDSNSNHPNPAIPWRTVGANLEENRIPQKSTIISISWMLMIIIIILLNFKVVYTPDKTLASELNFQCIIVLIVSILTVIHLPIMMIFTINPNFDFGISHILPSLEPQFHSTTSTVIP